MSSHIMHRQSKEAQQVQRTPQTRFSPFTGTVLPVSGPSRTGFEKFRAGDFESKGEDRSVRPAATDTDSMESVLAGNLRFSVPEIVDATNNPETTVHEHFIKMECANRGCHSRSAATKRKRQSMESEDQENINTSCSLSINSGEKRSANFRSGSKHDSQEQPSSPLSGPLTPRDVFTDQSLNRILGESSVPSQKTDRADPLPTLTWAKSEHLWNRMCLKDRELTSQRSPELFEVNPGIKPGMRAILLDWIIEVCEVYKMHRETYYLAVDYLDRYLTTQKGVLKSQLQLIGVTCLFIASKVEEIYPPKLTEFAYVTDGACKAEQILEKELVILKTLDWKLASVTVHSWLNLFIQICNNHSSPNTSNHSIVIPNHSIPEFLQASQLLDLCVLDEGSLEFSYSVLAASSIYLTSYKDEIFFASGLEWSEMAECVDWMSAFAQVIKEEKVSSSPLRFPSGSAGKSYLIQTHTIDLSLLEKAQAKLQSRKSDFTPPGHKSVVLLTPPSSNKKA